MTMIRPLCGAAIAALVLSACTVDNNRGLYEESREAAKLDEAVTDALQITGATLEEETLPEPHEEGPRLASYLVPNFIVPGHSFDLGFSVAVADVERVDAILLQLSRSERRIRIPASFDAEGTMTVKAKVAAAAENAATYGYLTPIDKEGRVGLPVRINLSLVTADAAAEFAISMRAMADQSGSTGADCVPLSEGRTGALAVRFVKNADLKLLITGGNACAITVWDVIRGQVVRHMEGHTDAVLSLALDQTNQRVISGSRDNTVRIWDPFQNTLVATLGDHSDDVTAIDVAPTAPLLATGSRDGTVRIRDLATGETQHSLEAGGEVADLVFSPTGAHLVGGTGTLFGAGSIRVWNTADWSVALDLPAAEAVTAVALSTAGDRLAAALGRGEIHLWSLPDGKKQAALGPCAEPGVATELNDGVQAVPACGTDVPKGKFAIYPPKDTIRALSFYPTDQDFLTAGTLSGVSAVWKLGKPFPVGRSLGAAVLASAFSKDGVYVALSQSQGLTYVAPITALAAAAGAKTPTIAP